MRLTTLADDIGKGIFAGLAGTAAMTISSTLEAKLRGRQPSTAPAKAATKALGIETFEDGEAYAKFSNLVHWGYGSGWGVVRALLATIGLRPAAATLAHGAAIWGNEQVMLPALDVAPPVFMWPREEVAIDAWHHAVYAAATGVAYGLLDRRA